MKDISKLVCMFLAVNVSTSDVVAKGIDYKQVELSSKQIKQVKATVVKDFYDPESSKFRKIRAADVKKSNGKTVRRVCGEVNGKNLYGAYTGYELFGGVVTNEFFKRKDFFMPCEPW